MVNLVDLNDAECLVCKASFIRDTLDEHGRCKKCAHDGVMPGITPAQDFVQKSEFTKDRIKQLIKEVLAEMKEDEIDDEDETAFKPKVCVKCGTEFVPRAPAQKICQNCIDEAKKETK
jgi:hypothetical protein